LKPQNVTNRPRFCYESGWVQNSSLPIAYVSAYSDTVAVTSCSRQSHYL